MSNNELQYFGNYRGKVLGTDSSDSVQSGKIKAEIYPMLLGEATARELSKQPGVNIEGIPIADLPWARPAMPITSGSGSGFGTFAVPKVGAFLFFFFEGGDPYNPIYFAEAPTATLGIPSDALTNYPNRKVIKTASGCTITIDDASGKIIITGTTDVIVQGDASVRLNPIPAIT
jgi:hypothetical protein